MKKNKMKMQQKKMFFMLLWVFSFGFSRNIAVSFPLALRFMMITNFTDTYVYMYVLGWAFARRPQTQVYRSLGPGKDYHRDG